MTLATLRPGQTGRIIRITEEDETFIRLAELGLIEGQTVRFIKKAPLGDPIEVRVMNYNLCLRMQEASLIEVEPVDERDDSI